MAMSRLHVPDASTANGRSVAVTASIGTCKAVDMREFAGGRVYIPSGSAVTSLTFYDAPNEDGTFVASYDDTLTTPLELKLTGLSASKSYPIPAKLFGAGFFKMLANDTGTVYVSLKS